MNSPEYMKEYNKMYRQKHKDELNRKRMQRYEANKEYEKARMKEYRLEHKDELSEKAKDYYRNNKDEMIKRMTKWNKEHLEQHRIYDKKYRDGHKEHIKEYHKKYYSQNKDVVLERVNSYKRGLWFDLIMMLGGKCTNSQCLVPNGCEEISCLQLDHINGGGRKEVKEFGGRIRILKYYLADPVLARKKLQVLCANCNWIKRVKNKEYRKKLVVTNL